MSGAPWSELMVTGFTVFSVSGSVGSETLCYCKAGGCIQIRFALSGAHETLLRKKKKTWLVLPCILEYSRALVCICIYSVVDTCYWLVSFWRLVSVDTFWGVGA